MPLTTRELSEQIDAWATERDRVEKLIAAADAFLAELAGLDDAEPATETPKPKAKPKPGPVTKVACPDCGKLYAPGTGLGVHRSRVHPDSAAKPVEPIEPIEPTPEPEPELDVETDQPAAAGAYECETCDFTTDEVATIRAHAMNTHARTATLQERQAAA